MPGWRLAVAYGRTGPVVVPAPDVEGTGGDSVTGGHPSSPRTSGPARSRGNPGVRTRRTRSTSEGHDVERGPGSRAGRLPRPGHLRPSFVSPWTPALAPASVHESARPASGDRVRISGGLGVRPLAVVATAGRMRSTVRATPVITAVRTGKASDRDRDGAWPVHAERFHQTARFPASVRLPACLVQGAHALPGRSPDGFGHRPGIGGPGLPYITSKTLGAIGGKWPPVTGGVISMPRRPVFRSDRRGRRDPFPSPFLPILCRRTARRWPPGTASRCFRRCHGHARPNPLSRTSPIWGKGVAVAETDRP